jgi:predicted alpha/beta hydrolase family esterase
VIHGTNDTVVPFSQAEELSQKLGCELRSVEGGGSFQSKDCANLLRIAASFDSSNGHDFF